MVIIFVVNFRVLDFLDIAVGPLHSIGVFGKLSVDVDIGRFRPPRENKDGYATLRHGTALCEV